MKRGLCFVFVLLFLLFLTGCWQHFENRATSSESNFLPEQKADLSAISTGEAQQVETIEQATIDEVTPVSFRGETWQEVYKQILLSDPQNYLEDADTGCNPEDRRLYLGIHDFDSDDCPELIIGDPGSAAVFTFIDGEAQKLADLCIPDTVWCINGLHARGNSISTQCNGSTGSNFVNFGFLDNEYVLGIYTELCNEYDPPVINGEPGTLDQMNRIYSTDYTSFSEEDRKELIRLVREGEHWAIHLPSEEVLVVDGSFDFERFLWK